MYLSNIHSWLLDYLMRNFPVPTEDVVSRVFIESSAFEQVVSFYPGMLAEQAGLVSSQAKPMEVYVLEVISGGLAKVGNSLSSPQVPGFPMAFQDS
ncbi:uncharacterized protein TNCV_2062781 [Trichonephila clavipes]|nr:uncharacterized protein TNCV_2062781 [Trichonephila clavipes]